MTRALTIADPPSLLAALRSPLPGANLLALAILHKAAATPADAAIFSTLPDLVEETVRRWLYSEDVGVAEKAARVLGDALETDCDVLPDLGQNPIHGAPVNGVAVSNGVQQQQLVRRTRPRGHARLWNLIIDHQPILSIITGSCSPSDDRTSHQTTLSQGRLLRLLPRLAALNITALTHTSYPEALPASSPSPSAQRGLLPWAATVMVDKSDILMHLNLVDFFETLVSVVRVAENRTRAADQELSVLVKAAAEDDDRLREALRNLPDRTVEEEAEPLRTYINALLA